MRLCVLVKKAMDSKLCLALMFTILGTLNVQGAAPRNKEKNPSEVFARHPGSGKCYIGPSMMIVDRKK